MQADSDFIHIILLSLTAASSLLVGIAACGGVLVSLRNSRAIGAVKQVVDTTHRLVNSQMDDFRDALAKIAAAEVTKAVAFAATELTKAVAAAHLAGVEEGRAQVTEPTAGTP
jgi:hypothetical protein